MSLMHGARLATNSTLKSLIKVVTLKVSFINAISLYFVEHCNFVYWKYFLQQITTRLTKNSYSVERRTLLACYSVDYDHDLTVAKTNINTAPPA